MGLTALLSSLAILASSPSGLLLAQADAPPTAQAPVPTGTSHDAQANADAVANGEEPFPTGAPTDDYGFVAWCYGALAGHLALYDKVLPQVRRIEGEFPDSSTSLDKVMEGYRVQHERGEKILANYDRALSVEEASGKTSGVERTAAVAKGHDAWKGSDTAEPRQLAQLWMSWALPDRCQSTAARIAPSAN
jgi:hypothetical protein